MWRFLRKRRALRSYRTTLFKHLRETFGRRLYYSTEQVRDSAAAVNANPEFLCYALGLFCDRAAFEAYHTATGEHCDYGAMRAEIFAHVADVPSIEGAQFDAGCTHHGHDVAHRDFGHYGFAHHADDAGAHHHDAGGSWDAGSHHP